MLTFLSFLIISGMIAMGIGAILAIFWMIGKWLLSGAPAMWDKWRELHGFTRIEFIDRAVDEITGTPQRERETELSPRFSPSSGCLAILLFLPLQLVITPIGIVVARHRKHILRARVMNLPPEQQRMLSQEYREWLLT